MANEDLYEAAASSVPDELAGVSEAASASTDQLLSMPNVVGVGAGLKETAGRTTDTPAVVVLVKQKLPESLLHPDERIPSSTDGRPTDVIEVGELFAGDRSAAVLDATPSTGLAGDLLQQREGTDVLPEAVAQTLTRRARPVRPGMSVGHPSVTAGTVGAACYDLAAAPGMPSRYYILSNNHVLANSNASAIGDPIYQPGRFDGGGPSDTVARLTRYVPIRFDGTVNTVDAAIAEVDFDDIDRDTYWIGYPTATAAAAPVNTIVKKTGRTTSFTTGVVRVVNATLDVNYGGGRVARFGGQIVTSAMSAGGDSGSVVTDLENRPVGLLFAGSPVATILNPIAAVQLALGVRLYP